jgi:hypothetical protein
MTIDLSFFLFFFFFYFQLLRHISRFGSAAASLEGRPNTAAAPQRATA